MLLGGLEGVVITILCIPTLAASCGLLLSLTGAHYSAIFNEGLRIRDLKIFWICGSKTKQKHTEYKLGITSKITG
jgi:hypothetical protein